MLDNLQNGVITHPVAIVYCGVVQAAKAPMNPVAVVCTGASTIAGFFASTFAIPFDYIKTQVQRQKPDLVTGKLPYDGFMDCAKKVQRLYYIRQLTFHTSHKIRSTKSDCTELQFNVPNQITSSPIVSSFAA